VSRDETNQRGSDQTVGVIGAGLMGSGIAQVTAQAGWQVVLRDVSDEALARGIGGIETSIARFVDKRRLTQNDADAAVARITTTT
jgi:3-hydroxybutyryl-CoA dehydrogenase